MNIGHTSRRKDSRKRKNTRRIVVLSSCVAVLILGATSLLIAPAPAVASSADETATHWGELSIYPASEESRHRRSNGSAVQANGQSEAVEHTAPWHVVRAAGVARYRVDQEAANVWADITSDLVLAGGAERETGSDGFVTLSNGRQRRPRAVPRR